MILRSGRCLGGREALSIPYMLWELQKPNNTLCPNTTWRKMRATPAAAEHSFGEGAELPARLPGELRLQIPAVTVSQPGARTPGWSGSRAGRRASRSEALPALAGFALSFSSCRGEARGWPSGGLGSPRRPLEAHLAPRPSPPPPPWVLTRQRHVTWPPHGGHHMGPPQETPSWDHRRGYVTTPLTGPLRGPCHNPLTGPPQ